jgi:hypothetical protein
VPVRQGVEEAGEVVAGAAGQIGYQAGHAGIMPRGE